MKKLMWFLVLLLSMEAHSQISLDFQSSAHLFSFRLNNSVTKYFNYDIALINSTNQLLLYNLDGSVYKTILMPAKPNTTSNTIRIDWISETLFDNDPSNIEYLAFYASDSSSYDQYQARVIREDGTVLLDELNAAPFYFIGLNSWDGLVYDTEEGAKLMLDYQFTTGMYYKTNVYNLAGEIPTGTLDKTKEGSHNMTLYPNPNNGSFFIRIPSNEGNSNSIDLYGTSGKLIGTYTSSGSLTHVNNTGLPEGTYLVNTRSANLNSAVKMIIKK